MIKNIVFDLGGVIIPLNRVACIRAFDDLLGYREFGKVLSNYRHLGFFDNFETGSINSKQFRSIIRLNVSPIKEGRTKLFSDKDIDYCLNCYLCEIPQDKIDALLFFKYDYKLYLLSNTNPIGMTKSKQLFKDKGYKMEEIFEELFLSYKMKLAKPSEEIFNKMSKKAGIVPEETLFIDDSPANIQTASNLGYHTILFDPKADLYDTIHKFFERK